MKKRAKSIRRKQKTQQIEQWMKDFFYATRPSIDIIDLIKSGALKLPPYDKEPL